MTFITGAVTYKICPKVNANTEDSGKTAQTPGVFKTLAAGKSIKTGLGDDSYIDLQLLLLGIAKHEHLLFRTGIHIMPPFGEVHLITFYQRQHYLHL